MSSVIARAVLTAKWGCHSGEYTHYFSYVFFFHQRAAVSVSDSVIALIKIKRISLGIFVIAFNWVEA